MSRIIVAPGVTAVTVACTPLKGSGCAYLESWHNDILEFLELRKNTGDDRRRTHDMNTANWIPDLFARNGVIHAIDRVLLPPDPAAARKARNNFV